MPSPNPIFPLVTPVEAPAWSKVSVSQKAEQEGVMGRHHRVDLCEDCTEVLVEQFLKGASVAPITKPASQTLFPHDPMTDCQLVWNPGKGAFLCYHDDPELYHALILDNAQNVAEGVPERPVIDKTNWVRCKDCDCTSAESVACQCECHPLVKRIEKLADDMHTAGWAHSIAQTCGQECSEQHTYGDGCILEGVVRAPEKNLPCNHMYPGTPCDWNRCATPGRLISQNGEDLTEAYSPQEPYTDGIPQQRGWSGDPDHD